MKKRRIKSLRIVHYHHYHYYMNPEVYISKDIDTTKIPLMGEDPKITKNITEDNINITKVPIRETKTLEINLLMKRY